MKCTVSCALGALAKGLAFHFLFHSPHDLALYSENFMSSFKRTLVCPLVLCFIAERAHVLFVPESASFVSVLLKS